MAGFMYEIKDDVRNGPSVNIGIIGGVNRDIFRSHRWHIDQLVGIKTIVTRDTDGEQFRLFAKKIKLPELSFEEEIQKGLGAEYKFAAAPKFTDATVEFYDVDGLLPELQKSRDSIWTPETGIRPAADYKKDTIFVLESPESFWIEFTLYGSYIKNLQHSDLTYETNGFKSITLTLSYDWFETKTIKNPLIKK